MKIFSWKPDLVTLFPSHHFGAIGDRVQSAACVKRTGKREHLWPFAEIEQAIQAKSLRLLGGKRQLVPAHVKRRFGDVGRRFHFDEAFSTVFLERKNVVACLPHHLSFWKRARSDPPTRESRQRADVEPHTA